VDILKLDLPRGTTRKDDEDINLGAFTDPRMRLVTFYRDEEDIYNRVTV
jgi:hypothetical protein